MYMHSVVMKQRRKTAFLKLSRLNIMKNYCMNNDVPEDFIPSVIYKIMASE